MLSFRRFVIFAALASLLALAVPPAGAQDEPDEGDGGPKFCEEGWCGIQGSMTIADAYQYGQAVWISCGPAHDKSAGGNPFDCPRKKDVDFKVTVIKSVKNTLGLSSRTISVREANGPSNVKLDGDEGPWYFIPLRPEVERKMKAKKVRGITVAVSGTATGRDGRVVRFSKKQSSWSFPGDCGGMGLEIQRHLTYGGTCYRH